jgi:uncharacterized protein
MVYNICVPFDFKVGAVSYSCDGIVIHPNTCLKLISPAVGLGVIATQFIPRGTLSWVKDASDLLIPADMVKDLDGREREHLLRYTYMTASGDYLLCADIGRYMNHSCRPNCVLLGEEVEIAVRDIWPGEELTNDYASFFLSAEEEFECACEATNCRSKVDSSVLFWRGSQLRSQAESALVDAFALPQPLAPHLSAHAVALLSTSAQRPRVRAEIPSQLSVAQLATH